VRDLFNPDGSLKEIKDMDVNAAAAIASFEYVTLYEGSGDQKHAFGRLNKIKLVDKGENLERLGRHLKLFTDVIQHELGPELTRRLSGAIDLSKLSDSELAEFNASVAALFTSGGDQRSLPAKSIDVAPESHKDEG
jgi:hypothetical protein